MEKLKNNIPKIILILTIIFLVTLQEEKILGLVYFNSDADKLEKQEVTISDAQKIFPQAVQLIDDGKVIKVYNNQNKPIAYLLNSTPYTNKIIGYAGTVPVMIGISLDDTIQEIELLKNYESPEYLDHIDKSMVLDSWNNQDVLRAIELEVDAVSGATETSEAIIRSVRHRLSVYKNLATDNSNRQSFLELGFLISLLVLFFAILSFYFPKKYRKLRIVLLIANVAVWGIWQGKFISVFLLKSWLINGVPVQAKIILFSLVILALVLPLFTKKNFYCNFICPFGSLQEILSKHGLFKFQIGEKVKKILNFTGYIILAVILLTLITGISFDLSLI